MGKILTVLIGAGVLLAPLFARQDGAEPGKTGGPFPAESVCTECHSGVGLNRGPGSVSFSVQPYRPGESQRITISVADPNQVRWGFQITARPANSPDQQAGRFRAVDANAQVICGDDTSAPPDGCASKTTAFAKLEFATHTRAGARLGTRNGVEFQVDWTAPSSDIGEIIFAAAGNAANGDSLERGDNIYTALVRVGPASASGPPPQISAGGVVGAGLSNPAVRQVAPNGIISIFGQNFVPAGTQRLVGQGELVDGRLPENFAGLCVEVGGQRARMFHVFPTQLNVQAPTLPGTGQMQVQVIQNCGASSEVRSNSETVTVQAVAPEFFFFVRNADGRNPIAAINAVTFGLIGAPNLIQGVTFTPARPGDNVALFATGLGRTDPLVEAGVLPPGIARTVEPVTVTVGGINADVQYAGVAPGLAGLYQINLAIPANVPDGDQPVVARIGGVSTPAGAFLTVRRQ